MNKKLYAFITWLLLITFCCSACSQASPTPSEQPTSDQTSQSAVLSSGTEPTSSPTFSATDTSAVESVSTPVPSSSIPSEVSSVPIVSSELTSPPETTVRADPYGVVSFVEEFLAKRARVEWLYEDLDLAVYFSEPLSDRSADFLKTIEDNKTFRRNNGTYRSHFYVSYDNHSIRSTTDGYVITLKEQVSFIILEISGTLPGFTFVSGDGSSHPNETVYCEEYTITVQGSSGSFRITDISTPICGAAY